MNIHRHHAVNVKPDAVSNAIHPTTYRGVGFLAHDVLKGSPPQVRGTDLRIFTMYCGCRITPAGAGNS